MARPHPPALPHGELEEVFPDVFFVQGSIVLGPMRFSRNMVVLREGERLVLVNTVRLDERGLESLDALGRVTDVIRLAGFHGCDDPFYKERYGCTVHAIKGQTYFAGTDPKKGEVYFTPDRYLERDDPLPVAGASLYIFDCEPSEALLRIPVAGGTLIAGDSMQNWATTDRYFSLIGKLLMRLLGFIKPLQLGAGWIKQIKPDRGQVRGILELDFENVLPAHGTPVRGGAKEKYRPVIEAYAGGAG